MKNFINGTYLNKLNRRFKELNMGRYDSTHSVYITETSFKQIDSMAAGRNQVSSVLQLVDQTMEVSAIHLQKTKYGSLEIFINNGVNSSHGFRSERKVLLKYRYGKSKETHQISLYKSWDREDFAKDNWSIDKLAEYCMEVDMTPELRERINNSKHSWHLRHYLRDKYKTEVRDWLYFRMNDLERGYGFGRYNEDTETLEKYGIDIKLAFPYRQEFRCSRPTYIKQSKDGLSIEIGMGDVSTYCSLPRVIKIETRKSERKLIRLCDLGVESPGYYSHDDRMKIKAEDMHKVKNFYKTFKRKAANNGVN